MMLEMSGRSRLSRIIPSYVVKAAPVGLLVGTSCLGQAAIARAPCWARSHFGKREVRRTSAFSNLVPWPTSPGPPKQAHARLFGANVIDIRVPVIPLLNSAPNDWLIHIVRMEWVAKPFRRPIQVVLSRRNGEIRATIPESLKNSI